MQDIISEACYCLSRGQRVGLHSLWYYKLL